MALKHALGAVVALTCVFCYHNSCYCGFVFDDISAIKDNRDLRPHTPLANVFLNDFWGTPMHKEQSHKSYRPLCVLTFRWNYLMWQLEPMGYHLVNMLLHSVVCLMYFRRFMRRTWRNWYLEKFAKDYRNELSDNNIFMEIKTHVSKSAGYRKHPDFATSNLYKIAAYGTPVKYDLEKIVPSLAKLSITDSAYHMKGEVDLVHTIKENLHAEPCEVFIFRDGVVVFWNFTKEDTKRVMDVLSEHQIFGYVIDSHMQSFDINYYTVSKSRMCSMFLPELSSFVAAMLFAVHPIHTEAVTGVVGRAETLSSVFFLAAFMFYSRAARSRKVTGWRFLFLSMISMATAMLCKEQGITVAGICAAYEIFVSQRMRLQEIKYLLKSAITTKSTPQLSLSQEATKRLAVLGVTTICLLLIRLQIMGSQLPVFTRFDNPASVASTPTRQLTYNYLISVNLWLLLFPCDLCCDWTMGTIPLVESLLDIRNVSTLMAYGALGLLAAYAAFTENRQQSITIVMSLALLILPFLPASNLFFPVGFVVAERVLYMPSMGFCLLVGYGWSVICEKKGRKLAWTIFTVILLAHGSKTYLRNWDWESEYSIFMSGLKVNQRNAKLFNNVGHALEGQGRFTEALRYFQTAVSVQEDDVGAHINVGRTYNHLKMFKEAEEAYLRAKSLLPKAKPGESYQARIAPNHLNVFLNLANLISKNSTRLEEADMLYRQAISMRADYTQAYINRGDILIKLNRTKEAQEVYERALLYDSNNPDIYYNLGVVFLEQGKASQALAYLDKALEFDPDHEQALLNSAILLQEFGRPELRKIARERLLKLLAKDESNERVHFNLGMLAMDDKDIEEAEHWFRRAVHLKNDFRSALFNLALLLADDQRPLEAAPFLNQLVKYHPDHVKGLILLGDIYINNIKDLDAAENCYKRILELDPENIQGLHNLCVVHVERGKLLEAQTCLEQAHELAPEEDYVLRHLQIVQNRIAKMKLNADKKLDDVEDENHRSKVISNKSIDETDRKTQPVVTGDSEEQRYSSRVVNTEPLFVNHVDNIIDDIDEDGGEGDVERGRQRKLGDFGADNDDPSSGMS